MDNHEEIPIEEYFDLLSKFHAVMLITQSKDGEISARPMAIARNDERDSAIWFAVSRNAGKVEDIIDIPEVFITAQEKGLYLTGRGNATVHSDASIRKQLWHETMRVWFPEGKDDPELAFLRVEMMEGNVWNVTGVKKLIYFFKAVSAYLTGTTPHIEDEHMKRY